MMYVYFSGQLKCGAFVHGARVQVPEDYTMNQLVQAIKAAGYASFMTETMHRLVEIN